jgi:hypothetical protein
MNLFITLLENVNKSRTSANNVSLNKPSRRRPVAFEIKKKSLQLGVHMHLS